jgi:plastocyanin
MRTLVAIATIAAAVGGILHASSRDVVARVPPRESVPSDAAVSIRTFQFAPDTLRVKVGTRVVWTNADEIEHTITSGTPDTRDRRFNGVVAKRGASYSAVLKEAGTYRYFCDRHRFMNGTVIVNP